MSADSLYSQYVRERQNGSVLRNEFGFIAFRVIEKECFISEMFIVKAKRNSGLCRSMIKDLELKARALKCEIITGNIILADKKASDTLAAALALGFDVTGANNNVLLIVKKIKGD